MSILPQATELIKLRNTIKNRFDQAKPDRNKLKDDLVTIAHRWLETKSSAYIDQCLYEFDCMTDNYAVSTADRAILGGINPKEELYELTRLSFAIKAVIYGQYSQIEKEDHVRLEAKAWFLYQQQLNQ